MTVSDVLEAQPVDREFDLDVDLQPVARNGSAERPARPTMCSCVECNSEPQTCTGCAAE